MRTIRAVVVVLVLVLLAAPVSAHVPSFPADNTAPERAVVVPDAAKSWSFYDALDSGQAKYYRFSLVADQRLQVGTFTPTSEGITPSIVIMSPSISGKEGIPAWVTVPDGMGAFAVEGERPDTASYEPFAPSANYPTASYSRPVEAETTYVVAIYEPDNRSGPVGVTIGYEEAFTPTEYLTVPFDLVQTHRWEGQHPLVLVGPFLLTVLIGIGLVQLRRPGIWTQSPRRFLLGGAGVLIAASGVNTAVQMGLALARTGPVPGALVTAVFVVVPVVCGAWVLWHTVRNDASLRARTRAGLAAAGVAALLTWAGFIVGPAILLAIAVTPKRLPTE